MRIAVPMRRIALFALLFGLALLLTLPLRLVLAGAAPVLTAREVSGSAWGGRLKETRVGPVAVGDLDARLSFPALLTGTARLAVARPSGTSDRLSGAFGLSARRRSAESVTGTVAVAGLFAPLPIAAFDLTDMTVRFRDGQCDQAAGLVRAVLSGTPGGLPLPAALSGAARCDRGGLLLPLSAGAGREALALRLFGDGRYEARVTIAASDPALVAQLTAAGFTSGPGGYVMTLGGRL